jgi:hypothetical protein
MTKHLIRHYGKYIYRHEDYQAICQGDDCASQILSLFEFWTMCRLEEIKRIESYNEQNKRGKSPLMQLPSLWLYETTQDISDGMLNAYGDSSIRKSLKKLIAWEFIDCRKSKNDFDKTKEYKFNTEIIQSSLDQWNAQSIENSDPAKTTHDPLEKTLESVKTTHDPLNLTADLYSLNSLNKNSFLTEGVEGKFSNPEQPTDTLGNKTEICNPLITPPEDLKIAAPPLNQVDNSFVSGRPQNIFKNCGVSVASDPWMLTAKNPHKEFAQWVADKRYTDKSKTPLADAKAEIRNNSDRASDLWDEYQAEMAAKAQKIAAIEQIPQKPTNPAPTAENQAEKYAFTNDPNFQSKAAAMKARLLAREEQEKANKSRKTPCRIP